MSLKLSSIIIAKNEEQNIARCLKSQLDCIDDIVLIIDDKSNDRTKEIASEFKEVRIFYSEWMGYAETKEIALSKTKNDWILWIDADEQITPDLAEELNKFKISSTEFSAYKIARRAYFLGKWIKHSGWYPGFVTRLFDKRKAKFVRNNVHESLNIDGETGKLKNDLNHFTDPNIFHYYEKFNKYTSLAAEDLVKKDRNAGVSDLVIRPIIIFLKMYIIRFGFLDGIQGLMLAVFSANYVFTKYSKLWEKNIIKGGK
ncbi:MAG: glycosyltransferase family 2 protein [Melioribacteraceae bacterium]|nr:glycosyltransferase family 2 protein [Melioribacteraceae bacterium]MCF8265850.1 glycosyltransferase family 2 protein [Melioribacteraceae bacterium]MCF8411791.1 glycosyltransferase family 2 protein [Melioribacteraceae bacterium]